MIPVNEAVGDTTALYAAVRTKLAAQNMEADASAFRSAFIDLNGDGNDDALVYLQSPMFCGSGGCSLQVYQGGPDGFTLDSDISLARNPIIVADTATDGWRDLVMQVSGGGAEPKNVVMQHSADGYPGNPSMIDAAGYGPFEGDSVLPVIADSEARDFSNFVGQTPHAAELWTQPFLAQRLQMLLYSYYDAFTERMQTVSHVQEENGVYYVTGNLDNAGGSDAAILVADHVQNVLKVWLWQNGELTEFAEAPIAIDLPTDVERLLVRP